MFKIGENMLIESGVDCYTLRYSYMGKPCKRDGVVRDAKMQTKKTYHATLRQACKYAIDNLASECDSVEKLIRLLDEAEEILVSKCKEA